MESVPKSKTNAEKLTKHWQGVATRLKRIELAIEDLREALECVLAEYQRSDLQPEARR